MSWHALAVGIDTAIDADTGSGGLRNASSPLITAGYNVEAAQGATYPYLVFFPSTQQELDSYSTGDNVLIDLDFSIFVAPTAGPTALATIANRLRTVFHRQTVTALAGSGWTARAMRRTGALGPFFTEHTVQLNETYQATLVS